MARKYVRRIMVSAGAGIAALVLILGYLLLWSEALERHFRKIHPDVSEAQRRTR
jgi:hypothetical protein